MMANSFDAYRALMGDPGFVDYNVCLSCDEIRDNNDKDDGEESHEANFPKAPLNRDQLDLVHDALRAGTNLQRLIMTVSFSNHPEMLRPFTESVLPSHPSLIELWLDYNNLRYSHIRPLASALKANTRLQILWLGNNFIGDSGVRALADALSENKRSALTTLYIGGNQIGDAGIEALADVFNSVEERTTRLEKLDLEDNRIGDAGYKALGDFLGRTNVPLTQLDLRNNAVDSLNSLEAVATFSAGAKERKTLQTLYLDGCFKHRPMSIRPLIQNVISGHHSLRTVWLAENNLTECHSEWIATALRTSKITHLNLGNNPDLGDNGVSRLTKALRRNQHLEELDLWNTGLGMAGIKSLYSMLKNWNYNLTSISFGNMSCISDTEKESIEELCDANTSLKKAFALLSQGKKEEADIPWKRVFDLKNRKPELVYEILRKDPANMVAVMRALANSTEEPPAVVRARQRKVILGILRRRAYDSA